MVKLSSPSNADRLLIVSLTPYFLERGNIWFEKNLEKILDARRNQSFFEDNTLLIENGQKYNFSQFLRKLDEMGYEKVYKVTEPGEFAQRGGIIDIFPINPALISDKQSSIRKKGESKNKRGVNMNYAVRIEFLGNKIENIEKLPIGVKNEKEARELLKKKLKSQRLFSDLRGLKPGDYLVHLDHGIGIYERQLALPQSKFSARQAITNQQYYVIKYAQGDKLYVPLGLERKLSRYIGFVEPKISRLGSSLWQKTKRKIKEEAEKFAKELLEIYAKRELVTRPSCPPADEIDLHLASSFIYNETPDQLQAIEDVRKDLEKEQPMDRLICGDVGFGKTEVALRAAIKIVKAAKQVTLICPTTILANQHFQNFKERLKNLPIKVSLLSRLQSKREQKETIEGLKNGQIDIVIGTHRILSKDVDFKNLGILIIDDEQRFGVRQKEKLKKLRSNLDILSLSATPIPRTLYMALSSLKNISLIQTPPVGRLPVKTFTLSFQEKVIRKAIEGEISRKGQVYYLHNRIETIESAKNFLENLVPLARISVVHGRLKERDLIKVMTDFQERKIDVLVATTIIENGLDLPNVNTLIVADSSRLGLSQAYQIRGRVGRSHIQAFTYLLHPKKLSPLAKERLQVLKEAEALGSGYRIALRDLEIRGAGNILGKEQSGSINAVGLNLYCQMLSDTIEKLRIIRPAP